MMITPFRSWKYAFCFLFFLPSLLAAKPEVFPGYFRIINVESGKLLESSESTDGRQEVRQRSYYGTPEQEWEIIWVGDTWYKVINRASRQVLDLPGGSEKDGIKLQLWEDLGGANQQWQIVPRGDFIYGIINRQSGKSLDLAGGNKEENFPLQQWGYHGSSNQQWRIEPIGNVFEGCYYIENDFIKVGVDADKGGAICWISEVGSDRNIVNVHDAGRYIQQSYYAGNSLNRQIEGQSRFWSPFPWNAIQAGDFYGNRPVILELELEETRLYVKSRPLLWDMNGEYAQAYMETWIELEGSEIIYRAKITRFIADNRWGEREIFQELPACYLSAELKHFFSYTGSDVWNFQMNPIPNSKIWEKWETHESWVACVDDDLWGFGVFFPGVSSFAGGLYLQGEDTDPTAYVSPQLDVNLPYHGSYEYRCYFQVGHLSKIHNLVYTRRHREELKRAGLLQE